MPDLRHGHTDTYPQAPGGAQRQEASQDGRPEGHHTQTEREFDHAPRPRLDKEALPRVPRPRPRPGRTRACSGSPGRAANKSGNFPTTGVGLELDVENKNTF